MTPNDDDRSSGSAAPGSPAAPRDYYGLPAIKPSLYGWGVALYIFCGGLAGGIQIIAAALDLTGVENSATVVVAGRILALLGAVAGGLLLIADLHTPSRFYNMLRIVRPTSPMSIGTYVLMGFGFFSLVAVAGDWLGAGGLATGSGAAAAVFGLAMTSYTAPLLSATSTPMWAAVPRLLACRFAASAIATGAAALFLVAWIAALPGIAAALAALAAVAAALDLAASILAELRYRIVGLPMTLARRPWGPIHLLGTQLLGTALPVGLYVYDLFRGAGAGGPAVVASLLVLGGGVLMRGVVLQAGNASAASPAEYLGFARSDARRPAG